MEIKSIEILYDHYKDTFGNIKCYVHKRNVYTIFILVLIAVLSFQIADPTTTKTLSHELQKRNIGNVQIDIKYLTSLLLFALLWVVMMYYQIIFVIEKHYRYLHKIETSLSEILAPLKIAREGEEYLNGYPLLSSLVHRIYTILFPIILIFISIAKWCDENRGTKGDLDAGNFIIDTILLFCISLVSILYLTYTHFNDFRMKKMKLNFQSTGANYERSGWKLIRLAILLTFAILGFFLFGTGGLRCGQIEPATWGQFGDVIGGVVGTIIAVIGVLLLFETLRQQRNSNSRQLVETRFFELLKLHRENVSEMQSKHTVGRNVFIDIKDEFHDIYELVEVWYPQDLSALSVDSWKKNVAKIAYLITFFGVNNAMTTFLKSKIAEIVDDKKMFDRLDVFGIDYLVAKNEEVKEKNRLKKVDEKLEVPKFDGYQSLLGHYFRHLFQTVTYINEQPKSLLSYKDKYGYIKTLRAQLSTYEQAIFFYNSISSLGAAWELGNEIADQNERLVTKYNLIKNIPPAFTKQLDPKQYYPNIHFESDETPPPGRAALKEIYES